MYCSVLPTSRNENMLAGCQSGISTHIWPRIQEEPSQTISKAFSQPSDTLCAVATDVAGTDDIFPLLAKSHRVVMLTELNTFTAYRIVFSMTLPFCTLLSLGRFSLCSHVAWELLGWCQGVSVFPGECWAHEREVCPVTPAGQAEQEIAVVLTAGLSKSTIKSNYGCECSASVCVFWI